MTYPGARADHPTTSDDHVSDELVHDHPTTSRKLYIVHGKLSSIFM
jgi:hypothetical protein